MSSLRLGLKRSLSGQDDSNDGGGIEGTASQQPVAKKKKATSPKPRIKTSPKPKPKTGSSRRKTNSGGKSSLKRRKSVTESEGGGAEDDSPAESAHGEDDSEDDEPPAASKAARGRQQQQQQRRMNAAVEEDEEDSDSDEEDYDDGYGSDLTGLPEVERERILLERYQKRQDRRDQLALRKRMQMNKGVAADSQSASAANAAKKKAARERAVAVTAAALEDASSDDSDEDNDNEEEEGEEDGAIVQEDGEEDYEDDSDEPPDQRRRPAAAAAAAAEAAARETSAAVLADEEDDDSDEVGGKEEEDKDDDDSAPVRGGVARAQGRGKRSAVTEESEDSDEEGDRNMDDGDGGDGEDDDARGETRGRGKGAAAARTMDSDEDEEHDDGKQSRADGGSSFSRRNRSSSPSDDDDSDESYADSRHPRGATASSGRSGSGGGARDRYRRSSRSRSRERRSRSRDRGERRGDRGYSRSRSRSRSPERGRRGEGGEAWRPIEPEPTLDDINRCRVPRDYLERWSNEPFFEKAVQGCFVRVSRGADRGGSRLYAMAEIVGVGPYKRRYKIGNSYTTKCLKISSSTAQVRDQCMDIVSNSRFTEEEYTRWKEGRKGVKAPTLTESQCAARRARMAKIVQGHKYSAEEVSKMVKERQKDGVAFKNIALSRITLSNSLEAAIANGKEEEADFCREQLAKLDEREAQSKKSLKAGAAGLRAVNERAKMFNVHTDASVGRQKRIEETKRRKESEAGGDVKIDPFQRRSCRPKILWSVGRNGSAPPPAGVEGGGGASGDIGVEEQKQSSPVRNGSADSESDERGGAEKKDAPSLEPRPVGLQKMHSFGGVDVLEAGKMALEKRLGAAQPKAAPRQGGKLTIGTYLQKARPPVDA